MSSNDMTTVLRTVSVRQREQWDRFISEHAQGHLLQSWSWGALKTTPSWSPLRLALWDEEKRQIVAAAQVLRRTVPRVPSRFGHLAYIPKGPVIDWSQPALCEKFFSQLLPYLGQHGAIALRMEPSAAVASPDGELAMKRLQALPGVQSVHAVQPLRTIMLDLEPDEETLLAQMKEKWRYNIRLAGRKGVKVRVAQSVEDVRSWYELLRTTSERDQFGIHTLEYYVKFWELSSASNEASLLLAEHEGQLLAGIFLGIFARQAIYLYGASSNERRQLMPNHLLQWEAIRRAKQQGATVYDFWGIPDTDDQDEAMAGVYRFKQGWGGRVVQFPGCYEYVYHPLVMKIVRRFVSF